MADVSKNEDHVTMKKQLGLVSTTSYVAGSIIGVGIFISPSSVLQGAGSSVGVALLIWMFCGVISYCGALCFADYGTRIKKSGGSYTYIREAFGDTAGFVFLWAQLIVVRPLAMTLSALTTAEYIIRPVFLMCPELAPVVSKKMLGFVVLGFFMMTNMASVRLSARLQTFSTVCKVSALAIVIVGGFVHLFQGHYEHFEEPFETKDLKFGELVLAIYAGIYAYMGWDNVNTAVEEIVNPSRNIPLGILGGLAIPALTYTLANVAYHAVLTNEEILSGVAVAVVFGERKLGVFKWLILPCVAISASGITNAIMFCACRLNFVGGRDGLFPGFLGMINVNRRTPQPSILFLFIMSVIVMSLGDVHSALGAYSFFRAGGEAIAIMGMFQIRRKYPATEKTYSVHWIFPIIYVVFFLILSTTAIVYQPRQYLVPLIITVTGVPVYYLTIGSPRKRRFLSKINDIVTMICQRLLLCEPSEADFS